MCIHNKAAVRQAHQSTLAAAWNRQTQERAFSSKHTIYSPSAQSPEVAILRQMATSMREALPDHSYRKGQIKSTTFFSLDLSSVAVDPDCWRLLKQLEAVWSQPKYNS